jgi:RNA polymerase sigma-70 factor (ECF subfamily)
MQRPLDPQRLLAQTAWVRRLALSLARDEASADDLVQETFVAALRRPPQDVEEDAGLRAWFATVVRNFAFRQRRETQRRVQRERLRSVPESSESEERARELEELRTELFEHVVALPEELREVVLLSFFEELDSAQIARRLEVPDSTVRNRLRRALAELRARLERNHGSDWRNLCLFVLPSTGAKVAAGTGAAVAAAGGLWLGGGAALVLALALLLTWQPWRSEKLDSTDGPLLAALPTALESKPDTASAPERAAPASERKPEPLAANTKPLLLYGRVLDVDGLPVKSGTIGLEDDRNDGPDAALSSEGWYSFTALAPGLYDVRVRSEGGAPLQTQINLRADSGDVRHDFALGSVHHVQVRLLRTDGSAWSVQESVHGPEREFEICVVATSSSPGKELGPALGREYSMYDVGCYRSPARFGSSVPHLEPGSSGVLDVYGALPAFASLCQAGHVLDTKVVDASTRALDFVLDETFVASLPASATFVLIDERSGAPAPGIQVKLSPSWTGAGAAKSDERGRVEFRELATGTLRLEPGGPFGAISRSVRITPGKHHDLGTVPWLPSRELRARILDSASAPAAADIHLTLDDPGLDRSWRAPGVSASSDASGEFRWQQGPGFATTIVATRKSPTLEAGAATLPRGEGQSVEIRMQAARLIGLRAKDPQFNAGEVQIRDSEGRTWAVAGRGWSIVLPDGDYTLSVFEDGRIVRESKATVDATTRSILVDD